MPLNLLCTMVQKVKNDQNLKSRGEYVAKMLKLISLTPCCRKNLVH